MVLCSREPSGSRGERSRYWDVRSGQAGVEFAYLFVWQSWNSVFDKWIQELNKGIKRQVNTERLGPGIATPMVSQGLEKGRADEAIRITWENLLSTGTEDTKMSRRGTLYHRSQQFLAKIFFFLCAKWCHYCHLLVQYEISMYLEGLLSLGYLANFYKSNRFWENI